MTEHLSNRRRRGPARAWLRRAGPAVALAVATLAASVGAGGGGGVAGATAAQATDVDLVPAHLPGDGTVEASVRSSQASPGDIVEFAQCRVLGQALGTSRCGPRVRAVVGADGLARATVRVTATLTVAGRTRDCRLDPCDLAAFGLDTVRLGSGRLSFDRPEGIVVQPHPTVALTDGAYLIVEASGPRDVPLRYHLCAATATGPEAIDGPCIDLGAELPASPEGYGWSSGMTVPNPFTGADGEVVTCGRAPQDCVVALAARGSSLWASVPVDFATASLAPSTGVLDGEVVDVTATGLEPNTLYVPVLCAGAHRGMVGAACQADGTDTPPPALDAPRSDADGTVRLTAATLQRFDARASGAHYCRDDCGVGLAGRGPVEAIAPYSLSEGQVQAVPATGLADGQVVTVAGTDLMSSYDGPPFWAFPATGQWALAQCDASVVAEPTILGVFTHCAPAGGGPVEVLDATLEADVTVTAAVEPVLGGRVDCTAGPDACVLALTRVEQDGSVTLRPAPITFTPAR
jgi:hypothetical protein